MELDSWIRKDMKEYVKALEPKTEKDVQVRHEDTAQLEQIDYHRRIEDALINDRPHEAKRIFKELRDRFFDIPIEHQEERKRFYQTLQRCYREIYDYIEDRHKTAHILEQFTDAEDIFDKRVAIKDPQAGARTINIEHADIYEQGNGSTSMNVNSMRQETPEKPKEEPAPLQQMPEPTPPEPQMVPEPAPPPQEPPVMPEPTPPEPQMVPEPTPPPEEPLVMPEPAAMPEPTNPEPEEEPNPHPEEIHRELVKRPEYKPGMELPIDQLRKPSSDDQKLFSPLYLHGIQALRRGDYGEALKFFHQRVREAPQDRAARIRMRECMEVLHGAHT